MNPVVLVEPVKWTVWLLYCYIFSEIQAINSTDSVDWDFYRKTSMFEFSMHLPWDAVERVVVLTVVAPVPTVVDGATEVDDVWVVISLETDVVEPFIVTLIYQWHKNRHPCYRY